MKTRTGFVANSSSCAYILVVPTDFNIHTQAAIKLGWTEDSDYWDWVPDKPPHKDFEVLLHCDGPFLTGINPVDLFQQGKTLKEIEAIAKKAYEDLGIEVKTFSLEYGEYHTS